MNSENLIGPESRSRRHSFLIIGLILIGLAYGSMLFYRGLLDPDEGRYSEIPREMVVTGHWDEMRMLGYRYYEKPPLAYWMVAPAIAVFGARDWAVRIPLLINILLMLALFYAIICPHWPGDRGRRALMVMVLMAGFFVGFCLVMTDGFLVFWFSLTCISLFWGFQRDATVARKLTFILLATVAAVLGFLTKGAVAVVLPALILVLWLLWEKRWRALLTPALILAGGVFLALLIPCLIWIERHNPGFILAFILDEHIARFTGTRLSQLHAEPFWYYIAILPLLLFPWTLFIVRAIRTIILQRLLATDALTRFFLVWIAVVVIFFSASTGKLISYILPVLPPLGLLLGRWGLAEPLDGSRRDRQLWYLGMVGPWLTVLAIILVWAVSFFKLAPKLVVSVPGVSVLLLTPLGLVAGIVLWFRGFRYFSGAMLLGAGLLFNTALLLSPLAGREFNVLFQVNSANVYQALAGLLKPEDQVVVFGKYRPALPFYTQKLPYMCYGMNELRSGLLMERDRPNYLWTHDDILQLVKTCPGRVYAVVDTKDYRKKFLPLKLNFIRVDFPDDPNTIVLELRPGKMKNNVGNPS